MMASKKRILVIKLGALGDFFQSLGPMAAIRAHHANDHITLMTTAPFESLARQAPYFDDIHIDEKPTWHDFRGWARLRKFLREGSFARVYDLQNSDRTALYLRLFSNAKRPEWVGAAPGASHRNASPERVKGHAFDGHVQTLRLAGIADVKLDTLHWMKSDVSRFALRRPYVLIAPGSSPRRLEKRWPAPSYALLTRMLREAGYQSVLLGSPAEAEIARIIQQACPEALDLTGRTDLCDIAAIARQAAACIGNDTGPVHIAALTGCPTLALLSEASHPVKHGPKGAHVEILREDLLETLTPERVFQTFDKMRNPSFKSALCH